MAKKVWKESSGKVGKNIAYTISDKGILTLTADLNVSQGLSKSGNSVIIASTQGNAQLDGGQGAVLGLNLYTKEGVS